MSVVDDWTSGRMALPKRGRKDLSLFLARGRDGNHLGLKTKWTPMAPKDPYGHQR